MKTKIFFYNTGILLYIFVFNTNILFGQSQVTRYTPVGSPVTAYNNIPEMTSGDKTCFELFKTPIRYVCE